MKRLSPGKRKQLLEIVFMPALMERIERRHGARMVDLDADGQRMSGFYTPQDVARRVRWIDWMRSASA